MRARVVSQLFCKLCCLTRCCSFALKQQEQLRDENKKLSTTTPSAPPASTSSDNPSTVTASSTVTSAADTVRRPSSDSGLASDSRGISDSSASRTEGLGPSSKQNRDSVSGTGSGTQASGKTSFTLHMLSVVCFFTRLCNCDVIKLVETGQVWNCVSMLWALVRLVNV